jgi:hypothetical protein
MRGKSVQRVDVSFCRISCESDVASAATKTDRSCRLRYVPVGNALKMMNSLDQRIQHRTRELERSNEQLQELNRVKSALVDRIP